MQLAAAAASPHHAGGLRSRTWQRPSTALLTSSGRAAHREGKEAVLETVDVEQAQANDDQNPVEAGQVDDVGQRRRAAARGRLDFRRQRDQENGQLGPGQPG